MTRGVPATVALLVACGGAGAGGSSFETQFADACGSSSNLEPAVCSCMATKAARELSEDERNFVLAALEQDSVTTQRLRGQLGLEGMMRAGTFMTEVSDCAGAPTPAKEAP